jgi:hypothetical protein
MKKKALAAALGLTLVAVSSLSSWSAESARAHETAPSVSAQTDARHDGDASDTVLNGSTHPYRWVAQWQMWDWTQYRSHATCMSRGRHVMRAFPDVQRISCRKPPRCSYWNLFTFREQWV